MANNLKQLDANQVLRSAYDPVTNRLRTDSVLSGSIGAIEVIIEHTNDSIRLGDGTTLFTGTTVGAKTGQDVNIINDSLDVSFSGISVPTITNVTMASANTEYSHTFPINTKKSKIKVRGKGRLRYSFSVGQSGTVYFTVPKGAETEFDDLDLTSTITIYFQSDTAGEKLEVLSWA